MGRKLESVGWSSIFLFFSIYNMKKKLEHRKHQESKLILVQVYWCFQCKFYQIDVSFSYNSGVRRGLQNRVFLFHFLMELKWVNIDHEEFQTVYYFPIPLTRSLRIIGTILKILWEPESVFRYFSVDLQHISVLLFCVFISHYLHLCVPIKEIGSCEAQL